MLDKVKKAIEKYGMLDYVDRVTAAVSGGADSVCLLYVLNELKNEYGFELSAIHINHHLRGSESDRDEEFVKLLCDKIGVPLKSFGVNVTSRAEQTGESVELAARNERYAVFKQNACDGVVATAHSADDNLETVIYNMSRGSGIRGLSGIPPKRDIYIRPLIFCTRCEIEAYLAKKCVNFVTDSTNLSDEYTRNYIRHNIVPLLKKINPSIEQTVSVMCANMREDDDFLNSTAQKIYAFCCKNSKLDAEQLAVQHPSIQKRVISLFLNENELTVDALHLEQCRRILSIGGRISLKKDTEAFCDKKSFCLKKNSKPNENGNGFSVQLKENCLQKNAKINNLLLKNAIDCGKINGSLIIRTRLPSDEIRLVGRNCTKSLKKLFNELKIPTELRNRIPVAADDLGVVWVYGVGVSERTAVDENTVKIIEFITYKINNN